MRVGIFCSFHILQNTITSTNYPLKYKEHYYVSRLIKCFVLHTFVLKRSVFFECCLFFVKSFVSLLCWRVFSSETAYWRKCFRSPKMGIWQFQFESRTTNSTHFLYGCVWYTHSLRVYISYTLFGCGILYRLFDSGFCQSPHFSKRNQLHTFFFLISANPTT